jgi:hypothetical protein
MKLRIPQPNLSFVNVNTGELKKDIWHELNAKLWQNTIPLNHEHSILHGLIDRQQRRSVFTDYAPLEVGQIWNTDKKIIEDQAVNCSKSETGLNVFLNVAEQYFSRFRNLNVGVQLSGGVDSSLIIGLLRFFKIPYTLVGVTTSRYEFRTEAYVQHKLASEAQNSILLDYENSLPMTGMEKVPPHQYPSLLSCLYSANQEIAKTCVTEGVDVLFTGEAGDLILGSEVPHGACEWRIGGFRKTWLADLVYGHKQIQLVPFYCDTDIANCFWNMRFGQCADPDKQWARNFFKNFLPVELVEYTYKADFWGCYLDGLIKALPIIRSLHEQAYEITKNPYFNRKNLEKLLSQKLKLKSCDQQVFQRIEARASMAVWYVKLLE